MRLSARGITIAASAACAVTFLTAQPDWHTVERPPAVDFSGLNPVKAKAFLRLLRNHDCTCGCGMKVAECRVNDPQCAWSKGVAQVMGDSLRAGKTENDAVAAAKASKWGQGPAQPKLLEDAVVINTAGSPFKGPADAKVTLIEFSDFQ